MRLPDSRRFRIGSSRVGNQIDSTLPTPSQSRMKQITRAQALKNAPRSPARQASRALSRKPMGATMHNNARFLITSRCHSRAPVSRAARTRMASKLIALMQTAPPITNEITHRPR